MAVGVTLVGLFRTKTQAQQYSYVGGDIGKRMDPVGNKCQRSGQQTDGDLNNRQSNIHRHTKKCDRLNLPGCYCLFFIVHQCANVFARIFVT